MKKGIFLIILLAFLIVAIALTYNLKKESEDFSPRVVAQKIIILAAAPLTNPSSPDINDTGRVFGYDELGNELWNKYGKSYEYLGYGGISIGGGGLYPNALIGSPWSGSSSGKAEIFSGGDGSILCEINSPNPQNQAFFGIGVHASSLSIYPGGSEEYIIGEPFAASPNGLERAGAAHILNPSNCVIIISHYGQAQTEYYGLSVYSTKNDINGDGVNEYLVGRPGFRPSGTPSRRGKVSLANLNNTLWESVGNARTSYFGSSIDQIGDVNGDGISDFVVGSPGSLIIGTEPGILEAEEPWQHAEISIISGANGNQLTKIEMQEDVDTSFGISVAGLGNKNGLVTFVIGAPKKDTSTGIGSGAAYIYQYGQSYFEPTLIKIIEGENAGDRFGRSVSAVGNSGGIKGFIVGAPFYDGTSGNNSGAIYYYSTSGDLNWKKEGPDAGANYGFSVGATNS